MEDALIVAALRTPIGRRGGALARTHPADLLAHVLRELVARANVDSAEIDDVIVGCVSQSGAQAFNIARTALLSAGFPDSVPGTTIDRQCGSSQQAIHFAAQGIASGAYEIAVAAGVEVMSMVPILSSWEDGAAAGHGEPLAGNGWRERYATTTVSLFESAELMAERYAIDRAAMEVFAAESHRRAAAAWAAGRFAAEVLRVGSLAVDEGFRREVDLQKMAALQAVSAGGRITAATSSQVSDGAAALLLASERAARRLGLRPLARVASMALAATDPIVIFEGPIPATRKVLSRAGLSIDDVGLFEVNEAFASVPIAWARCVGASLVRTNVNGGAIALGHPLGASGARLMTTLVHEMSRSNVRYGLQTMCEAGGLANATLVERVA